MAGNTSLDKIFVGKPDHPTMPEAVGTTMPLLATVLAGFALTVVLQLADGREADASKFEAGSVDWFMTLSFALSVPVLLLSAVFALWAQTYNYLSILSLDDTSRNVMDIPKPVQEASKSNVEYYKTVQRRFDFWRKAATVAYYAGILLFLGGMLVFISKHFDYATLIGIGVFIFLLLAVMVALQIAQKKCIKFQA